MLFETLFLNCLLALSAFAMPASRARREQRMARRAEGSQTLPPQFVKNVTRPLVADDIYYTTNWAGAVLSEPAVRDIFATSPFAPMLTAISCVCRALSRPLPERSTCLPCRIRPESPAAHTMPRHGLESTAIPADRLFCKLVSSSRSKTASFLLTVCNIYPMTSSVILI